LVIVAASGSLIAIVIFKPESPCGRSESAIERSVLDPTGIHVSPPLMVNARALTGETEMIKMRRMAILPGRFIDNCISYLKKWKFSSPNLRLSSHST
jgi:hypothetical protein